MNRKIQISFISISSIFFILFVPVGLASDTQMERETLRSVSGVIVSINLTSRPDMPEIKHQLKSDIELRLRMAGITVTSTERMTAPVPILLELVGAVVLRGESKSNYAFALSLYVNQFVIMENNPSIKSLATTWAVGPYLVGGGRANELNEQLREKAKDLVDLFINAYLSVNPKK